MTIPAASALLRVRRGPGRSCVATPVVGKDGADGGPKGGGAGRTGSCVGAETVTAPSAPTGWHVAPVATAARGAAEALDVACSALKSAPQLGHQGGGRP
jgi:hypothetical protein